MNYYKNNSGMKELLLFQAGNFQFGLNLPLVKSIHNVDVRFAEQAGRSHKLVQVMDGEEFPFYDLPSILRDETSSGDPMSQKVILVEAHEHPIALGVDQVERVVSVNSDHIHPLPLIFNGLSLSCFPRILKHEDDLILLLNPEGIENFEPEIPATETDTPKPEVMKSSPEEKETPGPIARDASDTNDIPQDSSQKSKIDNGEPASGIPYSEFTPPGETETKSSDLNDYLSETFGLDADFKEETTSGFVKKEQVAREELPQKEPFHPEESILSAEQEQVESEPSALNTSLEDMTPDTEDKDAHDTEEKTVVADIGKTAVEISKESFQPEESILSGEKERIETEFLALNTSLEDMTPDTEDKDVHDSEEKTAVADIDITAAETTSDNDKAETEVEGGYFETGAVNPATKSFEEVPGETQSEKVKDEVDEEIRLISYIGISLDPQGESGSPLEQGKPVCGDVPSQEAVVQPEKIVLLKEAKPAVETPEFESTDDLRSEEKDTATPLLPVMELSSAPTVLLRELEFDHGKQKDSYRGPLAVGVLALVVLLLISIWLWPKSTPRIPEVIIKPMPIAYVVREVRENTDELLQAPQPFETENQDLSQTPQPLNTDEKATVTAHTSLKAGAEVFRIETKDFTLTVERPKAIKKNGRLSASVGMTGKNKHSHIVMKNDTLWQIAKRYLGDPFRYPELAKISRISNPDRIYPGDVVRIINKNEKR